MIEIMDQKKALEFALKEERAEGKAEGKAETVKNVARKMHEEGLSLEVIARIVNMTEEEVLAILEEKSS